MSARRTIHLNHPPLMTPMFYGYITSALPPVFTLIGVSTLIFVQPPLHPLMFELQILDSTSNSFIFPQPDPSPIYNTYTDLVLYSFNCTRNSPHRHLMKCRSYRLEHWWTQISLSRRCPDFLVHFVINVRVLRVHAGFGQSDWSYRQIRSVCARHFYAAIK